MATRIDDLLARVLRLPPRDRGRVAKAVLASLAAPADDDAEVVWAAEVTRRAREVLGGNATLEDGDEVLRELRAEIESSRRGTIPPPAVSPQAAATARRRRPVP